MSAMRRPLPIPTGTSLALIILLCSLLMGCSSVAQHTSLPGSGPVLAFGDSITFGTGTSAHESYPALLERMIGQRVINAGIPGEITIDGLARLQELLERERPAVLVLCHGGNDLLRHLDRQKTADTLRAMIRLSSKYGAKPVLLAVPAPELPLIPPPFYEEIAGEFRIPWDKMTLARILSDESLKSDFIHPNGAGYGVLAEAVASLLKQNGLQPATHGLPATTVVR